MGCTDNTSLFLQSLNHICVKYIPFFSLFQRTCVVRRDYLHYIKKYNRFEKRHKNISAHVSPCFLDIALGDKVCNFAQIQKTEKEVPN